MRARIRWRAVARHSHPHRHTLDIRPVGPDLGTHHTEWWVRDFGCDVSYVQPGPNPEPWLAPYVERSTT